MKVISVFDTSIASYNLGNQIIMDSVLQIINELFSSDFLFTLPWEGDIGAVSHRYMRISDYVFFGGTNSLSSHMLQYKQMSFRARDLFRFKSLCLLGMGWWQYQGRPDVYTRLFLRRLLCKQLIHSVRDEYTKRKLVSIGVNSVANTCCPTTWTLTPEHCSSIPSTRSANAVATLTDYNKSAEVDARFLSTLLGSYDKVYLWVQGCGDLAYCNSFSHLSDRIILIPPKLEKYDEILNHVDCDYIGTRLHAGIRAIQKKKRALILAVDNRAVEISKDIGLSVATRGDDRALSKFINEAFVTSLKVPFAEIQRWKEQFA